MRQCVFLAQAVTSISHEIAAKVFKKHVFAFDYDSFIAPSSSSFKLLPFNVDANGSAQMSQITFIIRFSSHFRRC